MPDGQSTLLKIFAGNANPALSEELCEGLRIPMGKMQVSRFKNGEVQVKIEENVRGVDVFVVQPTCHPVNDHLVELLLIADAMRRASCKRFTAVMPYYGYARQDRKVSGREPISAKLVANLLTTAGCDRVLTMDLHAGQIQGFFDIPLDHLIATDIMTQYFLQKSLPREDLVVVSPDVGGVQRARLLAEKLGVPLAIITKRRPMPDVAEVEEVVGDVKGKIAIFIDDMILTGGSLAKGAEALKSMGAHRIFACATHAVLCGDAVHTLNKASIEEIVVTNTVPVPPEKRVEKIRVLTVAPLLAEAIRRIHEDLSVSELFETQRGNR